MLRAEDDSCKSGETLEMHEVSARLGTEVTPQELTERQRNDCGGLGAQDPRSQAYEFKAGRLRVSGLLWGEATFGAYYGDDGDRRSAVVRPRRQGEGRCVLREQQAHAIGWLAEDVVEGHGAEH